MARPSNPDLEPRTARAVTFTFGTVAEKGTYQKHAKRRGLTLAGLIKSLLADDLAKSGPLPAGE